MSSEPASAGDAPTGQGLANYPLLWDDVTTTEEGAQHRRYSFVLVSDLDHTMVQNEDQAHTQLLEFGRRWWGGSLGLHSALIYATGRSPHLYKTLWAQAPLLTPQVLICSVGTEILKLSRQETVFSPSKKQQQAELSELEGSRPRPAALRLTYHPDKAWLRYLDEDGWDRTKVVLVAEAFPQLVPQIPSEQRPHKVSYKLQGAEPLPESEVWPLLQQLTEALQELQLGARVIFSGGVDVDIIPRRAGKGKALQFLLDELKSSRQHAGAPEESSLPELGVQVCGDSGNDIDMMDVSGVNVCVVGRDPQLLDYIYKRSDKKHVHLANAPCAGGILEALDHFGTTQAAAAQPDHQCLEAIAKVLQHLGLFLADTVVAPVDVGSDATEDAARIDTGTPLRKVRGSKEVTVACDAVGDALAPAVPDSGLQVQLMNGLELRPWQEQQRASFVDVIELQVQASDDGDGSQGGARHEVKAVIQVYALLADGSRDLANSVTCTAELTALTDTAQLPQVSCNLVLACASTSFPVP